MKEEIEMSTVVNVKTMEIIKVWMIFRSIPPLPHTILRFTKTMTPHGLSTGTGRRDMMIILLC
jgi:hypothetical protein